MNPHDPTQQPGSHLVTDVLGVEADELAALHPPYDPRGALGRMVAAAAVEFDDLHSALANRARSAIEILQPYARGENAGLLASSGILQSTGLDIELLAARRGTAHQHLARLVGAYQRLLPEPATRPDSPERVQDLDLSVGKEPGRDDDWAIAGDRQTQALRAVERGGLRLKQSALSEQDRYLSDGTGVLVAVWAQTVERMLADGLLEINTATTPTHGQHLSLTPLGQEALRAADDAAAAPPTGPEYRDAINPAQTVGGSDPAVDPLPTREELLALEEIKRGRALLKERPFRPGLGVYTGSAMRISTTTVEAMQERGWIERDTSTSLNFGQQLSLTDSGEAAFRAGCAQDPRTAAALSRSTRNTLPSSPTGRPAAGAPGQAKPTRSR